MLETGVPLRWTAAVTGEPASGAGGVTSTPHDAAFKSLYFCRFALCVVASSSSSRGVCDFVSSLPPRGLLLTFLSAVPAGLLVASGSVSFVFPLWPWVLVPRRYIYIYSFRALGPRA